MSIVIPFAAHHRRRPVPPLVFVGLHRKQLRKGGDFGGEQVARVVRNCRLLLDAARLRGWPLGFVRISRQNSEAKNSSSMNWVEGFEPQRQDMVFERTDSSCYTSREFADAITDFGGVFVLAGLSGEGACLSTLIDAARHGHKVGFIEDASATRMLSGFNAVESHRALVAIASRYATIINTAFWVEAAGTDHAMREVSNDPTVH